MRPAKWWRSDAEILSAARLIILVLAVLAGAGCLEIVRSFSASHQLVPGLPRHHGELLPLDSNWIQERYGLYVHLGKIAPGATYVFEREFLGNESLYGLARASKVVTEGYVAPEGPPTLTTDLTTIEGTDYFFGPYTIEFILEPPPTTVIVLVGDESTRLVDARLLNENTIVGGQP